MVKRENLMMLPHNTQLAHNTPKFLGHRILYDPNTHNHKRFTTQKQRNLRKILTVPEARQLCPKKQNPRKFSFVVVSDFFNTACVVDAFGNNHSPEFDVDAFGNNSEDEMTDSVGFKFAHKEEAQEVANAVNFNEPHDFKKSA